MPDQKSPSTKPIDLIEPLVYHAITLTELLSLVPDWRIKRTLIFIHAAPQQRWDCENLATIFKLNTDYFHRRFTTHTGSGFSHYLETLRVVKARRLLDTTAWHLHQIAAKVGMSNELALRRAFKRRYGICPSRHRNIASANDV